MTHRAAACHTECTETIKRSQQTRLTDCSAKAIMREEGADGAKRTLRSKTTRLLQSVRPTHSPSDFLLSPSIRSRCTFPGCEPHNHAKHAHVLKQVRSSCHACLVDAFAE
eukprot:3853103-Pleurochrysis_carterae.AAC.3